MKKIIGVALILVVVLFALPFVVRQAQDTGQDPQPTAQEEAALPDSGHTLRVKGSDGQVTEMDLNQYLWGVVAAEMPASFSQEALKAQAVAARTYALNKGPSFNHPDADLCTDYACCQAWIARDKAQGNWGDKAAEYTNKITTAVAETGNQVILYQGRSSTRSSTPPPARPPSTRWRSGATACPISRVWTPPRGRACPTMRAK